MEFALDWLANFAVNEPTQLETKLALYEVAKAEELCPSSWSSDQIQAGWRSEVIFVTSRIGQ